MIYRADVIYEQNPNVNTNKTILRGWIIVVRQEAVLNNKNTQKIVGFNLARKLGKSSNGPPFGSPSRIKEIS